jgi:hypothetical protein
MLRLTAAAAIATCATGLLFAQSYPHAFPRDGVTKLFDNERITIWEVLWKTGGPQPPMHRHLYDLAAVYLRSGPIRVTTPDGKAAISEAFDVAEPGEERRLAIMVDLKDPRPGAVPPQAVSGMEPAFPREGAKDVLDNERVRFWDYSWQTHKPTATHVHERDSIEIFIEGGVIAYTSKDGAKTSKGYSWKDARFVPRGTVDSEEATSGTPRAMTIELK